MNIAFQVFITARDWVRAAVLVVLFPSLTATLAFFSWRPARVLFVATRTVGVVSSPLSARPPLTRAGHSFQRCRSLSRV